MKFLIFIFVAFFGLLNTQMLAQNSPVLEDYLQAGLKSNLALRQKQASYEKSLHLLREAKSYFYPQVSLNARYTVADGGRLIEFPIGDLLNPVYSTLNSLTGTNNFQMVENQSFRFLRPQEHETKIQVIQPLFNTDIYFNNRIKSGMVQAERADVEAYQRQLVAEIKVAYFNVLKTIQVIDLLYELKMLAEENQRVNDRLFRNEMVTQDRIFRAEAELSKIAQQIAVAEKDNKLAKAYFNFLLNRDLDSEILVAQDLDSGFLIPLPVSAYTETAIESREEISRLGILEDISSAAVRMSRMKSLPEMLLAMDYGFQGTSYRFTGDDDFVMASVVLRWNIFHGLQNRHKIRQSQVDELIIRTKKEEVTGLIKLEVRQSWYELQAAEISVLSAAKEHRAARMAYYIVEKQYNNGLTSLMEYLDARTNMSAAGTNEIISRFDYLSKLAEFERITCIYPLKNE